MAVDEGYWRELFIKLWKLVLKAFEALNESFHSRKLLKDQFGWKIESNLQFSAIEK